jgi:signal transduction histidine kinase
MKWGAESHQLPADPCRERIRRLLIPFMNALWRLFPTELFSPLAVVAYATWLAVWFTAVPAIAINGPYHGWLARGALLAFLAAFVSEAVFGREPRALRYWLAIVTMAASASTVIVLDPRFGAFVLLGILAAMLALRLEFIALSVTVLVISAAVLALLRLRWQTDWPAATGAAMGIAAMQLFAAFVMRRATRAETDAEQLRRLNAELLATRELLRESARNEERLRFARDLHDVAGHSLTALKLNLAALARGNSGDDERIAVCATLADDLMKQLRAVVHETRGGSIDLRSAIELLAEPLPRPTLHLDIAPEVNLDTVAQADVVLRTVQEGLTNAARHSNAANIWVVLRLDGDRLRIQIRDDGRAGKQFALGTGLLGMRERVLAAGGDLRIENSSGGGVQLEALLPVANR